MTDILLLDSKIRESGLKREYIANELGLTRQGFLAKTSGKTQFKQSEISILGKLLNLSISDVAQIFFAQ